MTARTQATKTTRTRKGSTIATTDGVVIAEQQHIDLVNGQDVLAGTDPAEVQEALAELPLTSAAKMPRKRTTQRGATKPAPKPAVKAEKPAKKSNRVLAEEAISDWSDSNRDQEPLVFSNHVNGNLLEAGTAVFAVMQAGKKMRVRVVTKAGGGAEVTELFDPAVKDSK